MSIEEDDLEVGLGGPRGQELNAGETVEPHPSDTRGVVGSGSRGRWIAPTQTVGP